jgi:signal transduction histidine kinase
MCYKREVASEKTRLTAVSRLCLCAGLAVASLAAAGQLPVEARTLWERDYKYVAPANLFGDSTDELVVTKCDSLLEPLDQNLLNAIASRNIEAVSPLCGARDAQHVWATYVRRDSLFLYDAWPRREIFVVAGKDIAGTAGWDGNAVSVRLDDLNADGRLEALLAVVASWDLKPRGVILIDWDSGMPLWSFLCGPVVMSVETKDIDADGKQEILCGTAAWGNGNVANGTDDLHTYAFMLNADDTLLWLRPIGHYSSRTEVRWLNSPEARAIRVVVCEIGIPAGDRTCDSLFVLDAHDGSLVAGTSSGGFAASSAVTYDGKGAPLILVAGCDDTLRRYDGGLRLRRKCALHGSGAGPMLLGHFTGQKRSEIAVSTTGGDVLLYDLSLRLLSRLPVGPCCRLQVVRAGEKQKLLVQRQNSEANRPSWQLVEFNEIPFLSRSVAVRSVLGGLGALLMLFVAALIHLQYQRTRDIRSVIRSLTGRAGTIELNRRGEVTGTNQKARELLGVREKRVTQMPTRGPFAPTSELAKAMLAEPEGTPPREMAVSTGPGQTSLVRCARVKTGAVLTIEDISAVEYLQRVKAWAPVAQKLAHGIKNPLNTILGSVEQIELKVTDEKALKYMGYVKDEVNRLRKMSDAFMRFTKLNPPALEPKNVNEVIKKVMAKYECRMTNGANRQDAKKYGFNTKTQRHEEESGMNRQESGLTTKAQRHEGESGSGGIELRLELDEKLPAIALDEDGLSNALEIVIENALEAMGSEQVVDSSKQTRTLNIKTSTDRVPPTSSVSSAPPVVNPDKPGAPGVLGGETRDFVRIEISDTGKGIPQKYLDKVFDPYFTYGKPSGTGLGLSLAKKIVEDHHGRVEIHSIEGKGTEVDIYLPMKA